MISYSHTIGIASFEGRGFMNPVDLALDNDGLLYVLSRSNASNKDVRVSVQTTDSEYKREFGRWGTEPGQTILPSSIAIDKGNRVYVSDEFMHNISVFDTDGTFIERWGELGSDPGHFNRPSGIRLDLDGNIVVVDHLNSRVQKFDSRGNLLSNFGTFGYDDGEFNYPWGLCVDALNNIWIADWRNDRIQKFDAFGHFLMTIGESGHNDGQLHRPSSVTVDSDGNIYVADWGNERIQVFDANGILLNIMCGEATLSKWALEWLEVNKDEYNARKNSNLVIAELPTHLNSPYHVSSQTEHLFWGPVSVKLDTENRFYVTEHSRHRIQIFQRCETTVS